MQVNEFKAWLEGFGEVMEGPPDFQQWQKIKKEIDELETSTGWHTVVERPVATFETTGIPNDKVTWIQNYDYAQDRANETSGLFTIGHNQ